MDISLLWPSFFSLPSASGSDGLTAGFQSGTSVPQLRAGRVRRLALQLLAGLRSSRRWGEATGDGSRLLSHPLSKKMRPKKARTLGWTQTDYLVGISKGFFQRVVKKRKLEAVLLCENATEMMPPIPSFPLCSCDIFHHLNTQFSFFFEEFLFCADGGGSQKSEVAVQFLNKLLSTQNFLQVSHTICSNPSLSRSFWRCVLYFCQK